MKKILSVFITVLLLTTSFTAVRCENDIKVTLNGQEIAFDVPPQIIDNRTLVPIRAIAEALGAEVKWAVPEENRVTVEYNGTTIIFTFNTNVLIVNDVITFLDTSPQIIDGRTLVPVRAISECFGNKVEWDGENRVVVITSAETEVKPTAEPSTIPIEYDDTAERAAHFIRNFKIKDVQKTDGGYSITYTLETFLEGRGTVGAEFYCYDSDGRVVDTFGGGFIGTDYTWSAHEKTAIISDKTVKISLIYNK